MSEAYSSYTAAMSFVLLLTSVSAGVTDSALTNHGSLQTHRLGAYLAPRFRFTHILSSDLKRAFKTAVAIQGEQGKKYGKSAGIQQLKILQEQDFGSYEGKAFGTRDKSPERLPTDNSKRQKQPEFQDAETKASMTSRMDRFLDEYLLPIIKETRIDREREVAIVSHGMILSTLWRCLLRRFAFHSVTVGQGVDIRGDNVTSLEHLGTWSNTGYLELNLQPQLLDGQAAGITETIAAEADPKSPRHRPMKMLYDWKIAIRGVNSRNHLQGLKRTGGGVGSSKHDESQKNIDAFFKKRRVG